MLPVVFVVLIDIAGLYLINPVSVEYSFLNIHDITNTIIEEL
jgi:hypothetical protein